MKNKTFISFILTLNMLISVLSPFAFALDINGNTIRIKTTEDFLELAKECTLDTWSQGKTVILENDISFSSYEFKSIPTFGGTFDGNGYKLSGISLVKHGSSQGVFRCIQQNGIVKNLTVEADIKPNGTKKNIGGIAGENNGTISDCTFNGTVDAQMCVGGIAGINNETGKITGCTANGKIISEQYTGGITGKNSGTVLSSVNKCSVNTISNDSKNNIKDFETDAGTALEKLEMSQNEEEERSVPGHTDTGGIAGYTDGIIQGCENYGEIGYPHVGYNIGGIAGRQSGFLLGCTNYGKVLGRKDVGGIAGQAEPYIRLNSSDRNVIEQLRDELDRLNELTKAFGKDINSDEISSYLDNLSEYSSSAKDSTHNMLNNTSDFVDDNLAQINSKTAELSDSLKKLVPVFDTVIQAADLASDSVEQIRNAAEEFEITAPDDLRDGLYEIEGALTQLSNASEEMGFAASHAQSAIKFLDSAITANSESDVKKALDNLSKACNSLSEANRQSSEAIEKIKSTLEEKPNGIASVITDIEALKENITILKDTYTKKHEAFKELYQSLKIIAQNTTIDFRDLQKSASHLFNAADKLADSLLTISKAFSRMSLGVTNIRSVADKFADDAVEQVNDFSDKVSKALDTLSTASDTLNSAMSQARDIADDISNEDSLEFIPLGEDFRKSGDDLFDSLEDISGEIKNVKNSVSNDSKTVKKNAEAIVDQFNVVMNLAADEFDYISNQAENYNLSDIITDVSDEDINNTKQGKISGCVNRGTIEADRNTGGIIGAMSIEHSQDPEDEFEKPSTLNFTYQTKAVAQKCINEGNVSGKKDCIGGITGWMNLGTVFECENYADVESSGGSYVGGIVGWGKSSVRKSYSKCKVTGSSIVGGISGSSEKVVSCASIVRLEGDESIGAIVGENVERKGITDCYFIDNGDGGIDGISYSKHAQPISYDEMKSMAGVPSRFISFNVTFTADGKTVKIIPVKYGENADTLLFPEIPGKKGYFGKWSEFENPVITEDVTINAEYKPWITVLESKEMNDSKKLALAMADGNFTDDAVLHVTDSSAQPPVNAKLNEKTEVWDLRIIGSDLSENDTVPIRIVNEQKMKAKVWINSDDGWKQADIKYRGKYILLNMTGTQNSICVLYRPSGFNIVYVIIPAVLAAGIAGWIVWKRKFKGKKKNLAA